MLGIAPDRLRRNCCSAPSALQPEAAHCMAGDLGQPHSSACSMADGLAGMRTCKTFAAGLHAAVRQELASWVFKGCEAGKGSSW